MTKRNAKTRRSEKAIEEKLKEWLWQNDMGQCFLSGRPDCDLIHARIFTGAGIKPPPWHTMPLARPLHNVQETGGGTFWQFVRLPDPIDWTVRLYDCFKARDPSSAQALMADMQDRADRDSMRMIFEGQVRNREQMERAA